MIFFIIDIKPRLTRMKKVVAVDDIWKRKKKNTFETILHTFETITRSQGFDNSMKDSKYVSRTIGRFVIIADANHFPSPVQSFSRSIRKDVAR